MSYTLSILFDEVHDALRAAATLYSDPQLHIGQLMIEDNEPGPFDDMAVMATDESAALRAEIHAKDDRILELKDLVHRQAERISELLDQAAANSVPVGENSFDGASLADEPKPYRSKRAERDNERVWINVDCPECGSKAGRPCVSAERGNDMSISHYGRKKAFEARFNTAKASGWQVPIAWQQIVDRVACPECYRQAGDPCGVVEDGGLITGELWPSHHERVARAQQSWAQEVKS